MLTVYASEETNTRRDSWNHCSADTFPGHTLCRYTRTGDPVCRDTSYAHPTAQSHPLHLPSNG